MKNKSLLFLALSSLFNINQLYAQEASLKPEAKTIGSLGLGVGFDYGGFGSRVEVNIVEHAGHLLV